MLKDLIDEELKPYKPLPKRSPFKRPNEYGQVPCDCIHFVFSKKHCWIDGDYDTDATDCKVLKKMFCDVYKKTI